MGCGLIGSYGCAFFCKFRDNTSITRNLVHIESERLLHHRAERNYPGRAQGSAMHFLRQSDMWRGHGALTFTLRQARMEKKTKIRKAEVVAQRSETTLQLIDI
eukprot:scaffold22602_cov154-Cylindrotheca_fusiformis.AAC.2